MADKSPGKPTAKKPGKTLKEKRAAKKVKRNNGAGPIPSPTAVTRDRARGLLVPRPTAPTQVGPRPRTCRGAVIYSERTGDGDQHVYCDTHAHWRRRTIRLPLVRRMRHGEQSSPSRSQADTS